MDYIGGTKEYILCAAIWYKDIPLKKAINELLPKNCDRGIVITGHRHGQCIWTIVSLLGLRTCTNAIDATGEHIQGFLTNKNRFVDRQEAAIIALEAKQITEETTVLFSEDLY